jgi:hypothetical protein
VFPSTMSVLLSICPFGFVGPILPFIWCPKTKVTDGEVRGGGALVIYLEIRLTGSCWRNIPPIRGGLAPGLVNCAREIKESDGHFSACNRIKHNPRLVDGSTACLVVSRLV